MRRTKVIRKLWKCVVRPILFTVICGIGSTAFGGIIYNEAVSPDLSNSGLTPTVLGPLSFGSNEIFGTTGRQNGVVDRDYFTITVPPNSVLTALIVLPGTQSAGTLSRSFIGVEEGPQVTLPTNATSAADLLGWHHYSPADIDLDILPEMGIPANGSTGFTPPLGPGTYSFWVQELSPGTFPYGFDLQLNPVVPEPSSMALLLVGIPAVLFVRRRFTTNQ
jgi:hypothetical protein